MDSISITQVRSLLQLMIHTHGAFKYSEEPVYKLSSGGVSRFYFDCRPLMLDPRAALTVGLLMWTELQPIETITAVGGMELGAVPIACAVGAASIQDTNSQILHGFVVRKSPKAHGTLGRIVGNVRAGDCVAVVDDVTTTGSSVIQAIEALNAIGVIVDKVLLIIDREECDAMERIRQYTPDVKALFTRTELMKSFVV